MRTFYFLLLILFSVATGQAQEQSQARSSNINVEHVLVPLPDGDSLSAIVAIDKSVTTALPAVLMYNIYADDAYDTSRATIAAEMGYAGIVVNTRGKNQSQSEIIPFKHDAEDAWHVLDWISKQSWCNGSIGMYGGSYLGFSQWAAVKTLHPALKTIVPQAAVGIGVDFPAHNGVYSLYSLMWLNQIQSGKMYDPRASGGKSWFLGSKKWFEEGWSFRALDSLTGNPNRLFREWLDHPSYSADYWGKMVPCQKEFANINIPILTITGYYDADQLGALYYYKEHLKYNPNAPHYLVIGPYDHFGAQGKQGKEVYKYPLSPAAQVNFYQVVFEWFDHILKGKERPALLKDKVNYQVMGTNTWKSAPTLEATRTDSLKFYLSGHKNKKNYTLTASIPPGEETLETTVNFRDRKNGVFSRSVLSRTSVISKRLKPEGMQFVSAPLEETTEITGCFSGELDVITNKKDFDVIVELFELREDGSYLELSHFLGRASYTKDRTKRQLLVPHNREKVTFNNSFLTSKQIPKGSRLVVVIGIYKNQLHQINYGTGKDVSDETIADASEPLHIQWLNGSFITIPVNASK